MLARKQLCWIAGSAAFVLMASSGHAQPLTPAGSTEAQLATNIQAIIAADAEWRRVNRWAIQQDVMNTMLNTVENTTVNKSATAGMKSSSFEQYLNTGPKPVQVSQPKFTASGKVSTTGSSMSPPPGPGSTPSITLYFRLFATIDGLLPRQSPSVPVWSSEFAFTCTGYGEWDIVAQSPISNTSFQIAPGEALRITFEVDSQFDTTLADGIVNYSLLSGSDHVPNLPELSFSSQWVEVPTPGAPAFVLAALYPIARRRR